MSKIKIPLTDKVLLSLYDCVINAADIYGAVASRKELYNRFFQNYWYFKKKVRLREEQRARFAQLVYRLKREGYLLTPEKKDIKSGAGFLLSEKGMRRITDIKIRTMPQKKRNDGQWYMVVFDIPEEKYVLRNRLRRRLKMFGFKQFQKSIWLCPYEVGVILKESIKLLRANNYVRTFLIREQEI
ncbi:MAG: hypothetical protein HYW78_04120 [Parcubacteria group bacterium]|nr:hypothetical protein [Parcubacteria group bacterium]